MNSIRSFHSGKTKLVDVYCAMANRFCNIDTIDDSVTGSFQQVDLNRHLEEIAQKIEAHLVRYQQNWFLHRSTKDNSSHFIKMLKQWEKFIDSSHNHRSGKSWVLFLQVNIILKTNAVS